MPASSHLVGFDLHGDYIDLPSCLTLVTDLGPLLAHGPQKGASQLTATQAMVRTYIGAKASNPCRLPLTRDREPDFSAPQRIA